MAKKKKYAYYVCFQEGGLKGEENKYIPIDEKELVNFDDKILKKYSFGFLIEMPDVDNANVIYSMYITNFKLLKFRKLSKLIDNFIFSVNYDDILADKSDDDDFDPIEERLDMLCNEYYVLRRDIETGLFTYIHPEKIYKCFHQVPPMQQIPFKFEDYTSSKDEFSNTDYNGILKEQLDKCFGKNDKGIITLITDDLGARFDITKKGKEYSFGTDEKQNELFNTRLMDMFLETASCTLRVYTKEIINKSPVKEIYAFILNDDFSIQNVNYLKVKDAHITNNMTGERIVPERNIVYCDIE
ncbi:MAG TPA: hypothetical protein VN026_01645, partial [Bacteroidia bacterium]|nr:hypothetical protein [Bacteroidia bacterium]